ncbi:MAG TPA: type II toxin-antitoxin system PemK/MazF family toxin [Candidatus Nanoarchaeia archaeon]|nr:type II toxin-antitoxin system PemK/MazF family toxin [Candidatus Nanoarchaeia archaeon]
MKKGEIWLVELPFSNSHEQAGLRPALILADIAITNISIVIPFTTNLQALRFPHTIEVKPNITNGLSAISVALAFHARAIDKKRLKHKIGEAEAGIMESVDKILKQLLAL